MQPDSVRCSRCGWRNVPSDRMCGGCGSPLVQTGPSYGTPQDYTPTIASGTAVAPPPLSPETQTASWRATAFPQQFTPGTATVVSAPSRAAPPYIAAVGPQSRVRRGNCLGRGLLILAALALLLLILSACSWAAFVRPSLHRAFDRQVRSGLTAEVNKVPVLPVGFPSVTRTFTQSEFNAASSAGRDQGDMKNIRVRFLPGEVLMTFQLWGSPGSISTHLYAENGRILVRDTQVTGLLAQFESGDEMEDALTQSLAHLPAQDYVERIVVGDGTLTVTVRHA
jgi:hypothetical protein